MVHVSILVVAWSWTHVGNVNLHRFLDPRGDPGPRSVFVDRLLLWSHGLPWTHPDVLGPCD